jgi:prevent-host-death family protein
MLTIGSFEAKTHLAQLLERVERGEEITITRRGRPVARLVPIKPDHDSDKARRAAATIRAIAAEMALSPFDWNEWKRYRDEGRR